MAERSDIDLVMDTFRCDEVTAKGLIDAGVNVSFIRNGIDAVVEPELHMADVANKIIDKLSDTIGELQKDA